jgi:myo-inositol-1-phosphate synthase
MTNRNKIKVALVGIGNCASSLVQGVSYYQKNELAEFGVMTPEIGGYCPKHLEFSAAFDVSKSKVGKDLAVAIGSPPNNTIDFCKIPDSGVIVHRGPTLDGLGKFMYPVVEESDEPVVDVASILSETRTDVLVSYLPVGSQEASEFYANEALKVSCAMVNCIPVFLASNETWRNKFAAKGIPIIGDDIKSQLGATILHRTLVKLFQDRGVKIDKSYQLNFGGNADFRNMLEQERLTSKKISKTQSVESQIRNGIDDKDLHVGPSDFVPWLEDRKICNIRIDGIGFGETAISCEVKLEVWDSPNSAAVVLDAIRCAKIGLENGLGGALEGPSAWFMKSPPKQHSDETAKKLTEEFIQKYGTPPNNLD